MKNNFLKSFFRCIGYILMTLVFLFGKGNDGVMLAAEEANMSNLVIFVNFADTALKNGIDSHAHSQTSLGKCFEDADYTFELFDGEDENGVITNRRSMKQYLDIVSYGELALDNVFPQYDAQNHVIVPLTLSENAQSYVNNDDKMISEIISLLNSNYQNKYGNAKIDFCESGVVDNLMIVVACEDDLYNYAFSGHKATYAGNELLSVGSSNYLIRNYTLVTEGGAYFGISGTGLLIHEFMHTLGYPDLYCQAEGNEVKPIPVGAWDIMANENYCVQYPLAYMRQSISGWLDLPTVTTNQTGYTLTAASATNETNKNTQAVILKTPYSDTEFFVIEYRKQGADPAINTQDFDSRIAGSGIIIYRVNTARQSNIEGAPFMIYVYRPGDNYNSDGYENAFESVNTSVYLKSSYLSAEAGRTAYGSTDLSKSLADNAITYSDGTNSGIVISNVGSANGDTITFDITFADGTDSYWNTVTNGHANEHSTQIASCMDANGNYYFIKNNGSINELYQYTGTWTSLGTAPYSYLAHQMEVCDGVLYTAYVDVNGYAHLAKWSNGTWTDVFKSTEYATEIAIAQNNHAIYFAYSNEIYNRLNVYTYNGSALSSLGSVTTSSNRAIANPCIASVNGDVFVLYRDFSASSKLIIKKYDTASKVWNTFGNISITSSYAKLYSQNNMLYVLTNYVNNQNQSYLYAYDLSTNAGWEVLGDSFLNEYLAEMDMSFANGKPYITYMDSGTSKAYVKTLENGTWVQVGTVLSNNIVSGLDVEIFNSKVWVSYCSNVSNQTYIRNFQIDFSTSEPSKPDDPNVPNDPSTPDDPNVPNDPSTPDKPNVPDDPSTPDKPNVPDDPSTPDKPNVPDEPSTPDEPESPVEPDVPAEQKQGWLYYNGNWYYYSANGVLQTGWIYAGGNWYYMNHAGVMQTGWLKDNGIWYYLKSSGAMATGWIYDGAWYYLKSSGAMATGWIYDGAWYYLKSSGAMATGWIYDGAWYYLKSSGAMATGWIYDGAWYYLKSSGAMATGWIYDGNAWYYMNSSGAMQTGWLWDGVNWYYLNDSGAMVTGKYRVNGKYYYFNSSGAWIK